MKTYTRICLHDYHDEEHDMSIDLHRGHEYITSEEDENGTVVVFTSVWARVPVSLFAGEIVFT